MLISHHISIMYQYAKYRAMLLNVLTKLNEKNTSCGQYTQKYENNNIKPTQKCHIDQPYYML